MKSPLLKKWCARWSWKVSKSKPHYLKTRDALFDTKGKFKEHLKAIRYRAEQNSDGMVTLPEDISDLRDFIQDYCDKSETIQERFDLDKSIFVVKKSPQYETKCLFIVENGLEEQISTEKFGTPPTPLQNFRSCCSFIIGNYKKSVRQELAAKQGKDFRELDLWHQSPTTKQIVDEFLTIHNLHDKLAQVASPNGLGNNVPYLLPEYEYLEQEFLDFYDNKVAANEMVFDLRKRKK